MATSVRMEGIEELSAKLQGLKYDVLRKGGRFALRKAAQVVRNEARKRADILDDPQTPNKISRYIVEQWSNRTFKATGDLKFRVGVEGGARQYANTRNNRRKGIAGQEYFVESEVFYWRYLEFGTEKMSARPFMVPALESSTQAATNEFIRQFSKAVDRSLRTNTRKG